MPVLKANDFQKLFLIMASATAVVSILIMISLYRVALNQYELRLIDTVKSHARLIEAMARFEISNSEIGFEEVLNRTVDRIIDAHSEFEGFGDSGEFTLTRIVDDQIVFLISQKQNSDAIPAPIPLAGKWAEPARRALDGQSGFVVGPDYQGTRVLAAYEPISVLNLGLVAKINIEEVRAPFMLWGLISLGLATIIIFIASRIFFSIARPIETSIAQQNETFRILAETAHEGIFLVDEDGKIDYVNPAGEALFGYEPDELLGQSVECLMPEQYSVPHSGYMKRYLETGEKRFIGSGRQLTAKRKNGTRFPVYLSLGDINVDGDHLFTGVFMDLSEAQTLQNEILEISSSEQRRIGYELHDSLGQQLTGLGLLATSLVNKASKPDFQLASQLAGGIQEAIAQVRSISRGLAPASLETNGLKLSLQSLANELKQQAGVRIKLETSGESGITNKTTMTHLYRITQEALNNAIKHANADEIIIRLTVDDQVGMLSVEDDGQGMLDHNPGDGMGLRILKHRSNLINAELHIDSDAEGTAVRCVFPMQEMNI